MKLCILVKAKSFPIGTLRVWKGVHYIKKDEHTWTPYTISAAVQKKMQNEKADRVGNIKEQIQSVFKGQDKDAEFVQTLLAEGAHTQRYDKETDLYMYERIVVPPRIKRKYPELTFALTSLIDHLIGFNVIKDWKKVSDFLKDAPSPLKGSYYRVLSLTKEEVKQLKEGKKIQEKIEYPCFSKNSNPAKVVTQNEGAYYGSYIQKKEGTPVFDISAFMSSILKELKAAGFKSEDIKDFEDTYNTFKKEEEVIFSSSSFSWSDIVKKIDLGNEEIEKDREPVSVNLPILREGSEKVQEVSFSPNQVDSLVAAYKKYNGLDFLMQNIVITTDKEESITASSMHVKNKLVRSENLEKLIGSTKPIYVAFV